YLAYDKHALTYEANRAFRENVEVALQPTLYDSQPNQLYRNLGGLRFQEVAGAARVTDRDGRSLGALWLDLEGDLDPDLLVTTDEGSPDSLFINQGDGTFREAAAPLGLGSARASHGAAAGDLDNDGDPDLLVTTPAGRLTALYLNHLTPQGSILQDQAPDRGVAPEAGVALHGWGAGLADFDLDGDLDVLIASGVPLPDPDAPRITSGQPLQLLLNRGDGHFTEASGQALADRGAGRGVVVADFDNDGDPDAYVAGNNGLGRLLRVTAPAGHRWLGLQLEGRRTHRHALGARVTLTTSRGIQSRYRRAGTGFLSGTDPRLLFGLGPRETVAAVTVIWPDGQQQRFPELASNRYWRLVQGRNEPLPVAPPADPLPGTLAHLEDSRWRRLYLKALQAAPTPDLAAAAGAGLEDPAPAVRLAAVAALVALETSRSTALAVRALEDPDPSVRLAALDVLQVLESEAAVRWLLRALEDPEPTVRSRAAGVFGHFFAEEEAVVVRKYLAVAPLLRLLEDPEAGVRIAAARALGEAERFRAVGPLLERLEDPDPAVRREAVRALGLIRERMALPAILALVRDTGQPPAVRAQGLIAARRLAFPRPEALVAELLDGARDDRAATTVMETVAAALTPEEGMVLSRRALAGAVTEWLEGTPPWPQARTVATILLQDARDPQPVPKDPEGRPAPAARPSLDTVPGDEPDESTLDRGAVERLLALPQGWAQQRLQRLALDRRADPKLRLQATAGLVRNNSPLAGPLLQRLARAPSDPLHRQGIELLARAGDQASLDLLERLVRQRRPEDSALTAARALLVYHPRRLAALLAPDSPDARHPRHNP
ncbi:MAG: FG-GAP-like repeat-containing protein, partial [Candidatus Competibacteraceae bacterium]|nr:FG-GAP-like repeat-containing protein [Candidatus Competibacteraceae bacterium]